MSYTISKANEALNAISLIRKYFNQDELLKLVTANFYSKLYYNFEVWQIPTLNQSLKNKLLTASSRALKLCAKTNDISLISFKDIHEMTGRATPDKLAEYKLALQLYRTITHQCPIPDWIGINLHSINSPRKKMFAINRTNKLRVGNNALANRLNSINGKIDLNWLNLSFNSYKIKCKRLFL